MMRLQASIAACALTAAAASPLCPFLHCGTEMKNCLFDAKCRELSSCQASCAKMGKNFGGCAEICHQDHPSDVADKQTACLFDNGCMPIPFAMVDHCKTPKNTKPLGTKMLVGMWWTVRGYDKTADCEQCNFREWHPKPHSAVWSYGDNTGVVDKDGNNRNFTYFNDVLASQTEPKDSLVYHWGEEVGMDMKEEWWLLDETDDYKQIYYCTTDQKVVPGNQLEGGLILSKTPMLSVNVDADRIAKIFKENAGIDYSKFCTNNNTCATGPSKKASGTTVVV